MRQVDEAKVACLTLGGLSFCPVRVGRCATGVERRWDGAAEVSRGRSSRTSRRRAEHVVPEGARFFDDDDRRRQRD